MAVPAMTAVAVPAMTAEGGIRHRGREGQGVVSQRVVEVILAQWRAVERQLAETDAGTPDSEWLQGEASRLRNEYRRNLDALRESQAAESETPTATTDRPKGGTGLSGVSRDGRQRHPIGRLGEAVTGATRLGYARCRAPGRHEASRVARLGDCASRGRAPAGRRPGPGHH